MTFKKAGPNALFQAPRSFGRGPGMSRHHTHLNARRWAAVRWAVFERDGYRCVECGRAGRLECDHVVPLQREPGQDPYDPNGLQTLCRGCHLAKTATENRRPSTPAEAASRELVAEIFSGRLSTRPMPHQRTNQRLGGRVGRWRALAHGAFPCFPRP